MALIRLSGVRDEPESRFCASLRSSPVVTGSTNAQTRATSWPAVEVPENVRLVFRSLGQVFFQENALTGLLFAIGIALSSPRMALGAIVGSAIGSATAWILKFDRLVLKAGIYGINAAVIGIATL